MFETREPGPRARRAAAWVLQQGWRLARSLGSISPEDALGRRFARMGDRSCVAFPFGDVIGEQHIEIGEGTLVAPLVCLAAGMPGEAIDPSDGPVIVIGDRCTIGRGSSIVGRHRIVVEDDVVTGPNTYVTDHNHEYRDVDAPISTQWPVGRPVRIGAGSWLGAGVTVLPGADIGSHVAVAAGSVVRGRIPDNSVAAGAPARVVRRFVEGAGWVPGARASDGARPGRAPRDVSPGAEPAGSAATGTPGDTPQ